VGLQGATENGTTMLAMMIMYPYMYPELANLSGGLEFTGTLQSPSGTNTEKKALRKQGLFFRLEESGALIFCMCETPRIALNSGVIPRR